LLARAQTDIYLFYVYGADGKGFVECRSFAGAAAAAASLSSPRLSRAQLVDYLRTSERAAPDVVGMKSTPLCSVQSLLVAVLHDYWLAKYVVHVMAAGMPRPAARAPADARVVTPAAGTPSARALTLSVCTARSISYESIRYDTICYFSVRSKADISQIDLPHGTENYKKVENRKTEKVKNGYARKYQ